MAKMPGAVQAKIPQQTTRTMDRYDIVCVHTIVGYAPAHAAHFSTEADGTIIQSRDTKYRSAANLDGNHRVIAIENEDHGPRFGGTPKLPKWVPLTPEQVESCAQILAWAHKTHGVPLQLCPDSRPGSRGLAYHRQGIDGNFTKAAGFKYPGRVSGGEVWTTSPGKVCPTDVRIDQLPAILARAKEIVNPVPKDRIGLIFFNMPRGHDDKIHVGWPQRGYKAVEFMRDVRKDATACIAGFSEFPGRALAPLREKGVRVKRGRANYWGKVEKIGNALGWIGRVTLAAHGGVQSLPFNDNPHGKTILTQPIGLFRTKRGGGVVVIQVHDPVIRNIDKILVPDVTPKELINRLNADVLKVVRRCVRAGFVVVVGGDFNGHDAPYKAAGGEQIGDADVQEIYLWVPDGVEVKVTRRPDLKTHGVVTDHGAGSPTAYIDVPPWEGEGKMADVFKALLPG